jgi:hypothetical protein
MDSRHKTYTVPAGDLDLIAADHVARGGRIEFQTPRALVVVHDTDVNHVLHALMTLMTLFLWLPVWFICALFEGERRIIYSAVPTHDWAEVGPRAA